MSLMPCAASHKPKSPQQLLQEALDAAFPTLGINPQLLMKKRGTPDPALPVVYPGEGAPKKRKQSEPEDSRPPKKSRTGAQDSAIYCPWPQCDFKGGPCQLWEHLQASHEQVGRHPAPKDLVRCNWDGCVFEGTPAEVVGHFECKHDRGHSGRGRNAPESPGPEEEGDEENQERNTSRTIGKVQCHFSECKGGPMEAGRTFFRHAYGKHWHNPKYVFWCHLCGDWKRKDQNCAWRSHLNNCVRRNLADYGPPTGRA